MFINLIFNIGVKQKGNISRGDGLHFSIWLATSIACNEATHWSKCLVNSNVDASSAGPNVSAYRLLSLPNHCIHCADHGTIWLRVHQARGSILFLTSNLSDILIPQIFDVLSRMLCKLLLSFIRNSCKYLDFSNKWG